MPHAVKQYNKHTKKHLRIKTNEQHRKLRVTGGTTQTRGAPWVVQQAAAVGRKQRQWDGELADPKQQPRGAAHEGGPPQRELAQLGRPLVNGNTCT